MKSNFKGVKQLARLVVKRDKIRVLIWTISILALSVAVALAYPELFSSPEERIAMAETMRNPAMIAMVGPGYGFDNYTSGPMFAHSMLLFTALTVGIMNILLVTRHTRKDEEEGRIEMVRSLPVGRLASLRSILSIYFVVNVIMSLVVGIGLAVLGIETMGFNGSLLYGVVLGVTGFFFATLTALLAQLLSSSRGVIGYSFAFLGLSYILRGIGDISSETLSLISPLGLILRTETYVNNYWWPVIVLFVISLGIAAIAFYLNYIRDLEAGFFKVRKGRTHASKFLQSSLGLSFRLQKTTIIAWLFSMFILGASYGSVFGDMNTFFESSELLQKMLPEAGGLSLVERFMPMLAIIMAILGTIPTVQMITKLRSEEKNDRTDHIVGRSVSRYKLLGGYYLLGFMVSVVGMFLSGYGMYFASAQVMDNPIPLINFLKTGMIYLPAIWVMLSLATFLIGFYPKGIALTWIYLMYSFLVNYLGQLLNLPEIFAKLTPFAHTPQFPVEQITVLPLLVLTLISIGLSVYGFIRYRKRDLVV